MYKTLMATLCLFICSAGNPIWAFDCNKAYLPVDHVICSSPEVMRANDLHELAWYSTRSRLTESQKKALVHDQRKWLREYPPKCGVPSKGTMPVDIPLSSQSCVIEALLERVKFLKNYPESAGKNQLANIPSISAGEGYINIREKMIAAGWKPFHIDDADACSEDDLRCAGRPEMVSCSGTGRAYCMFLWEKNRVIIGIVTAGEGENPLYSSHGSVNSKCYTKRDSMTCH